MDAFEVVGVLCGYFLAVCVGGDSLELCVDVVGDSDAFGGDFVEFLEVRVVVVEEAPELEVEEGCFLKLFADLIVLFFKGHFGDQIEEIISSAVFNFSGDEVFEIVEDVVLLEGEL